jgi:hypothetical protein
VILAVKYIGMLAITDKNDIAAMHIPAVLIVRWALPGVITHLYRSHPIRMIAIEDKNIGNFCAAMHKLISELWLPKGQFSDTIALKLIGRVRVHSIKSDNATVPMKALCAVRILFLQKRIFFENW